MTGLIQALSLAATSAGRDTAPNNGKGKKMCLISKVRALVADQKPGFLYELFCSIVERNDAYKVLNGGRSVKGYETAISYIAQHTGWNGEVVERSFEREMSEHEEVNYSNPARTLPPSLVVKGHEARETWTVLNQPELPEGPRFDEWCPATQRFTGWPQESGWSFRARIRTDYYAWIRDFVAWHPEHGFVFGSYEDKLTASSSAGLEAFMTAHPAHVWDYWDI